VVRQTLLYSLGSETRRLDWPTGMPCKLRKLTFSRSYMVVGIVKPGRSGKNGGNSWVSCCLVTVVATPLLIGNGMIFTQPP
jgi:hypothetical protein